MATQQSRAAARIMIAPAVFVLLVWMLVPLIMTVYFSFADYRPMRGVFEAWGGFKNYESFLTSSSFLTAVGTTLWMVCGILSITIVGGGAGVLGVCVGGAAASRCACKSMTRRNGSCSVKM